jgi:hypothetical protein
MATLAAISTSSCREELGKVRLVESSCSGAVEAFRGDPKPDAGHDTGGEGGSHDMSQIRIVVKPTANRQASREAARPLTHHEILALMGPFSRRGHHADMTATRRTERHLLFKPVEHPSPLDGLPLLRDVLALEIPERGEYRLLRTLTATDPADPGRSLSATLTIVGPDPEALLDQIERVPPERHFPVHEGTPVQRSYRIAAGRGGWVPVLTGARAGVGGLTLEVDNDRGGGMPAHVHLSAPAGKRLAIPPDLLAVLGRPWRPLEDYTNDWRGSIRLPKHEPQRTRDLEDRIERAIVHLADTLSKPPADFHPRHRGARWRVALRRGTPLLVALGMIAATPAVSLLPMGEGSILRMLIFHAPPLMLAGFFLFSELPRIEIPPFPRRLKQACWIVDRP